MTRIPLEPSIRWIRACGRSRVAQLCFLILFIGLTADHITTRINFLEPPRLIGETWWGIFENNQNVLNWGLTQWMLMDYGLAIISIPLTCALKWVINRICTSGKLPQVGYLAYLIPLTVGLIRLIVAANNHQARLLLLAM